MSQKQKVVIGGVIGVAFIIAFGLFLSDVGVEYDLSPVDFVICNTSIGTVDPTLTPEEFAALDLDALGCVEYFLVHMICDHDFATGAYHGTYAYEPAELTIPVGKTVVWRNDDIHGVSGVTNRGTTFNPGDETNLDGSPLSNHQREFGGTHDVTFSIGTLPISEEGVKELASSESIGQCPACATYGVQSHEMSGGGEWSYTFLERGEFPYYCSIHPWMTGTVHVV